MASTNPHLSGQIWRYRPVIAFGFLLAAGCTAYYLGNVTRAWEETGTGKDKLHRSNAVRRPRGPRPGPIDTGVTPNEPSQEDSCPVSPCSLHSTFYYGDFVTTSASGERVEIPMLNGDLPSSSKIMSRYGVPYPEAAHIFLDLEKAFLDAFFARVMPPGGIIQISDQSREQIVSGLGLVGSHHPDRINDALDRYGSGELEEHPNRIERQRHGREDAPSPSLETDEEESAKSEELSAADQINNSILTTDIQVQQPSPSIQETIPINEGTVSQESSHIEAEVDASKQSQSLLGLLYAIGEDQANRNGYVHRGVTCNSCNIIPIRGIRYRCANCVDYDLCEQCEALQMHPKTHLFYKVRIPAPFLGNPRKPEPVWYPGKPKPVLQTLGKEEKNKLCQQSGFDSTQVEALWEQFRCLAAAEWNDDPLHYNLAIDRRTFDRCFIPKTTARPPPPNLIYDRIFSFYDSNHDSLIGFEEFLLGIACLQNKGKGDKLRRTFDGYDIDRDGFVDRRDFLRMMKALYNLHKELSKDIIGRLQDDENSDDDAHHVVTSRHALSSAFAGPLQDGERSRTGDSKRRNEFGDYVVKDDSVETIREDTDDTIPSRSRSRTLFGEGEDGYGQEVLYEIIEESINELLDPLFKMREDLALEVIRTSDERRHFPEEISGIVNAGFWRQIEPAVLRFERKWRTNKRTTVYDRPSEAQKFLEYLKTSENFIAFDPAAAAPSSALKELPPTASESARHTRLSTPDWEPESPQRVNQLGTGSAGETMALDRFDVSDADLAGVYLADYPGQTPDDNLENAGLFRRALRSPSDGARDDALLEEIRQRGTPSEGSEATTVNEVFNETAWDILGDTNPEEKMNNLRQGREAEGSHPTSSAYELAEADRPLDTTLPQNRGRRISITLDPADEDHVRVLEFPSPSEPQLPPESYTTGSILHDLVEKLISPTNAPPSSNTATPANFRSSSVSKLQLPTPPPPERLKELALIEMLKVQDEKRGGWGRLSWQEFEQIMKGPKGTGLGFVGNWVDMATF